MNGQIVLFPEFPDYCPVVDSLNIIVCTETLDFSEPEGPLSIYKKAHGIHYLTGLDTTAYYCLIMILVMPNISDEEVKLISAHSVRDFACVLLHEARKNGPYIKLCL